MTRRPRTSEADSNPTRDPEPARGKLTPLLAILSLAFAVRLAAVLWLNETVPYSDFLYYHLAAEKIVENWGFFFDASQAQYYGKFGWWPPLYPFSIASLYAVLGVDHRVVVFAQVLLGTLLCWLVYRIGQRVAGERVGLVAALLVAINPTFVFMTNLLASENLFTVLLAWAVLLAVRPWRSARMHLITGVLFGLAALTRAIGLMVPAIAALWLHGRAPDRRAWLLSMAWLLAGSAVTIAPWTVRNAVVVGSPAIICFGGGLNFYFGHNEVSIGYRDLAKTPMIHLTTQQDIDRTGYRLGLRHLARNPLGFVTRGVQKVVDLFGPPGYAPHTNSVIMLPDGWRTDPALGRIAAEMRARQRAKNRYLDGLFTHLATVHSYLILAGAVAASLLLWRRMSSGLRLCVYVCAYWVLSHVLFWGQPRFRYPMEIFMALLAAFAIVTWTTRRERAGAAAVATSGTKRARREKGARR